MTVKNPFIITGKIPPEYFCDRKAESQRLIREVTNGNNLVLISRRRMGKTGLIRHCFDSEEIAGKYNTFYIDILQTSSLKEFTYLLGREVFSRLMSHSAKALKGFVAMLKSIAGSFGFDPISGLPTFNLQLGDVEHPATTLEEIFRYLSESEVPSIVAIDEFQQIANYKEDTNVEALLRSHIQHLQHTNFIFAGSERHMLQQMFLESPRPFYNSAAVLELDAIDKVEYERFAVDLFSKFGKNLSPGMTEYVYSLFDGNTFYLQRVFNSAFSNTPAGKICTLTTINDSITELLFSLDTIFRELLSTLNESQKQVLIAVAKEVEATNVTSSAFVRKHALQSASSVQSAINRLITRGILYREQQKFSLQDPLLQLWLVRTYGNIVPCYNISPDIKE
ncbi:MAG: ATPase [Bacteroides sp.]|nr:ATPase [Bacteroides sp.]MCM1379627.1 ATPase [Bacteroides sp.]MCM1445991.1 ATPase [Prevotella sp.]